MALTPSTRVRGYISQFRAQNFKMTDCFLTEYMSDNDTKLFLIEENIVNRYDRFLKPLVTTKVLTNEELRKYKCNPWRCSDDLYGTTALWFMLLHINEMYSATEFTRQTIKVYSSNIMSKLNEIRNVEKYFLDRNAAEIYQDKKDINEGIDGMWD